ncbi:MAG: hypothetical protein GXP35_03870 [Actinobacteria bacterium]|nr:hypothetical protein [Actinomycetota bacterium]
MSTPQGPIRGRLVSLLVVTAVFAVGCVNPESGVIDATAGLPETPAVGVEADNPGAQTPAEANPLPAPSNVPDAPVPSLDDPSMPPVEETPALDFPEPILITEEPPDAGVWGETVVLVEAFWGENFAAFAGSGAYRPLDRDRIVAVDDNDSDLPACDRSRLSVSDIEQNAFAAVCREGQLVAWDDDDLFVDLFERFGATGPAIVIAHEFGHVSQFQAGVLNQATVVIEQQADCLAGAFARWMDDRQIVPFDNAAALDAAVGSTISFRDRPGSSAADPNAHGSGFDRVRAFQDGFESGVEFCAFYDVGFLSGQLTEITFTENDRQTGGNLAFVELIDLVNPYFDDVFGRLVDDWPGLVLAPADLDEWRALHSQIGDNATGLAMALEFGAEAQRQLGLSDGGVGAFLQQTCLAGAAFRPLISTIDGLTPDSLSLSAGDMDEAVLTLSRIVESNQDVLADGFLFEVVDELRTGFTDGFEACGLG